MYVRHTHAHIPVYQDQPVQETFGQLLDTSPSLPHVALCVHVRGGGDSSVQIEVHHHYFILGHERSDEWFGSSLCLIRWYH